MRITKKWIVWLAVMTLIALALLELPSFIRSKTVYAMNSCANNLRELDGAKQQWSLENHKTTNDIASMEDVLPYVHAKPVCPNGGTYIIGRVGDPPRCSIGGRHAIPQ